MRIAIVKLSAMGDIIHAMVVLQFIKKFNKKITIDWIVEDHFKELLNHHPHINEVHTVNFKEVRKSKSLINLFKEFKKIQNLRRFDLVIDMQGLIKSALISKLIPSKKIIGFDKQSIREKLAAIFYNDKFNIPYSQNVIERNTALIGFALGFHVTNHQLQNKEPFIFTSQKNLDFKLSSSKKNIIFIPGASHISKCYPAIKFAELSKLLDANFIVIWGSKKEKLMAQKIKELSPDVNISNELSIDSLIYLISNSDLVIGPDTGPTHISWALNIPSITLFGSTPGYRNTYVTMINKIIESESNVNPLKINKDDFSIQDIDVKKIYVLAKNLLH